MGIRRVSEIDGTPQISGNLTNILRMIDAMLDGCADETALQRINILKHALAEREARIRKFTEGA
jgi:hypothetical protein